MSTLSHLFILISYTVIAGAVAVGLPETVKGIDHTTAVVIGGVGFVGAALLHEIYSRRLDTDDLAQNLHKIRVHSAKFDQTLESMRRKVASFDGGQTSKNQDTLAEMRMLKALLGELAEKSAKRLAASGGNGSLALAGEDTTPLAPAAPEPEPLSVAEILSITRGALDQNRVDLYLQPVVSLPQRKLRYYEAFSRIRGEDGEVVGPEQYIPIAEEAGLVSTIDNMLLFRCVQHLRKDGANGEVGFFCNISSRTLADASFFDQFVEFMEQNATLAKSLVFEFSQADAVAQGALDESKLARLAELGFTFSMDQLSTLDVDFVDLKSRGFRFVKIEASKLVSNYEDTKAAFDVYDLAEALRRAGISLIAEKVEDEPVVTELLDFAVDFGQGYLFGEPRRASRVLL